jgi:hypothetical protein
MQILEWCWASAAAARPLKCAHRGAIQDKPVRNSTSSALIASKSGKFG